MVDAHSHKPKDLRIGWTAALQTLPAENCCHACFKALGGNHSRGVLTCLDSSSGSQRALLCFLLLPQGLAGKAGFLFFCVDTESSRYETGTEMRMDMDRDGHLTKKMFTKIK